MVRLFTGIGLTALFSAFGIGCALAAGVTLGEWLARTVRHPRSVLRAGSLRRPQLRRVRLVRPYRGAKRHESHPAGGAPAA